MSPFLGDDDMETIQNISSGEYEYPEPEENYEDISDLAKEFIDNLLVRAPKYELIVTNKQNLLCTSIDRVPFTLHALAKQLQGLITKDGLSKYLVGGKHKSFFGGGGDLMFA